VDHDQLTGITPARWRDRALGFVADDDTPSAEIIRCADEVHGVNALRAVCLLSYPLSHGH
jgi:hypothetical protein